MAKATIKDVAKKAGVGVGTVSRVINNSPSVSPKTRRKVKTAIAALNYQPNELARRLSLGKTYTVGVIAPFFTRPAFVQRLRGFQSVFSQSIYDFVIYNVDTHASRDKYFQKLTNPKSNDGLVVMSVMPEEQHTEMLLRSDIPTVMIDVEHSDFSCVIINDLEGGYQATKHLVDLGHRRIGMISDHMVKSPFNYRSVFQRHQGYRKALEEASIPFRDEYFMVCRVDKDESREAAVKMLSLPTPPTAIFAYSDTHAFGVLQAAESLNIKIPEALSVIGYDDIELSEFLRLTTIRQNLFDTGATGAHLILNQLANPNEKVYTTILDTKLVIRRTTSVPLQD